MSDPQRAVVSCGNVPDMHVANVDHDVDSIRNVKKFEKEVETVEEDDASEGDDQDESSEENNASDGDENNASDGDEKDELSDSTSSDGNSSPGEDFLLAYWVYRRKKLSRKTYRGASIYFFEYRLSKVEIQKKSKKTLKKYRREMMRPDDDKFGGPKRPLETLFVWRKEQIETMQQYYSNVLHREIIVFHVWSEPLELVTKILRIGRDTYLNRMKNFLWGHVFTLWPYGEKYLVHMRSPYEDELECLDTGFTLIDKSIVDEIIASHQKVTENWLSPAQKEAKYPWKTGEEGWKIIQNASFSSLKVKDVKNILQYGNANALSTTIGSSGAQNSTTRPVVARHFVESKYNNLKKRKQNNQVEERATDVDSIEDRAAASVSTADTSQTKKQVMEKTKAHVVDTISNDVYSTCKNVVDSFLPKAQQLPPYFGLLVGNGQF